MTLSYFPALQMTYLYHDDILFIERVVSHSPVHPLFYFLLSTGRFLGAFYMTACSWLVQDITGLNLLRWIVLLEFSLSGVLLVRWLEPHVKFLPAFGIAVMIFTLPACQVTVSWTGICYLAPAVLFSLLAAMAAASCHAYPAKQKYIRLVAAALLQIGALSFYPSAATFYWVIPTFLLAQPPFKKSRNDQIRLQNLFAVGLTALTVYAVLLTASRNYLPEVSNPLYDPHHIAADYRAKLVWFFKEPFINALNLWNIFPSPGWTWGIAAVILLPLLGGSIKIMSAAADKKNIVMISAVYLFLGGTLLFLCFLPNLLAAGNVAFYRCSFGLGAFIIILLARALQGWTTLFPKATGDKIFIGILAVSCIYGSWRSFENILYHRCLLSAVEFQHIKSRLNQAILQRADAVHYIRTAPNKAGHRYDEFGTVTAHYSGDLVCLTTAALIEILKQTPMKLSTAFFDASGAEMFYVLRNTDDNEKAIGVKLKISSSMAGEQHPADETAYLIDLRGLAVAWGQKK